jgi:predicted DNA-binding transcriptional regulator YafY
MEQGSVRSWLLNTFAINNLINESQHLKHRILFEEIPSGQRFLTPIIEAMRDNLSIELDYQPFWHDELIIMNLEPYCLKIFKQRWYVIARNAYHNAIRTYSLDRIQEIRTTKMTFKIPKDFNAESYFKNSFGIVKDANIEPCVVKLKVFGQQRKYLQTLPLHSTQQEIEITDDYSIFSYYIAPTQDFESELLSHGIEIEVISPDWLRTDIANKVKKMNNFYE